MKVSLKAKLTGLISFLVLLVVLATSTLYLSNLVQQALAAIGSRGEYVANEIYSQARDVLAQSHMPAGSDPSQYPQLRAFVQSTLAGDAGLNSLLQSAIAYSPTVYYVAITDVESQVMLHNDPNEIGRPFASAPPFRDLARLGLLGQLRVIYGPRRVYEVVLPLEMGEQPLGDVRVGVSNLFLRDEIDPALRKAVLLSVLVIVLATLSAGLVSYRALRPLETISRGVDRWARGEYAESIKINRKDEWGILSSKLNLLGEQMRGEKAAFVALKENLDQLFSNLTDGILLFDKQDTLVLATPAVSRFLHHAPGELIHRPVAEVFPSSSPLDELLRDAFAERRSLFWKTAETPGDSQTLRAAVTVQFVEEQGERVGALVTLRDASTRAHLEDQIEIAAKLAALGKITSGVAHEVKNPLNAMVLQVELLKAKLGTEEQRVEPQLRILSDELRRLDRVVKTFLDFTRPVELRPRELDMETLVREVFALAEPQAKQNNVELIFDRDGVMPSLLVDPDLMKQALLNLVLNGCQAMPAGGQLKVTPRVFPDRMDFEIADQGVGIPPEVRAKIFSLFFSTKPGGTGVGLAMAFRIVQLHNGSLDFASEVDRGTTFRVSLPR
jgi:signal transduction histidine kinase/HAMP domain-containing protein